MRCQISFFFVLSICSFYAYGQEDPDPSFNFKWDNGFKVESADKNLSLDFGGQIFLDHAYFFPDNNLEQNFGILEGKSRSEFRSVRFYFAGNIYENTKFKFQIDLADEKISLKDVYVGINGIPAVGTIRAGHFNEPFRLSSLTSGKYTTFMERASNNSFSPKRNTGIMVFNNFLDERLSAQFGVFHNASNASNNVLVNDGYVLTGRITTLPYIDSAKNRLLHLGAGFSHRKPDSHTYLISVPTSSHQADKYLQTGLIPDVKSMELLNFETAYLRGPVSLQAEYLIGTLKTIESQFDFSNYYAELSWFITGEHKDYKGSYEGFGRVKPRENFGANKGIGAWEVAARYSKTDLSSKEITGGVQSEVVLGLNWYLNPVTRLMLNYAWTEVEDQGKLNLLQARFQVDF